MIHQKYVEAALQSVGCNFDNSYSEMLISSFFSIFPAWALYIMHHASMIHQKYVEAALQYDCNKFI